MVIVVHEFQPELPEIGRHFQVPGKMETFQLPAGGQGGQVGEGLASTQVEFDEWHAGQRLEILHRRVGQREGLELAPRRARRSFTEV